MTAKHSLSVVAGVAIAPGPVNATAEHDIPPYDEEESTTVIYNFAQQPVNQTTVMAEMPQQIRILSAN